MRAFLIDRGNRSFFRFWLAQLISQFGDRVHQMALVGLIAARSPGSSMELAKLLSFTIIPVFLIGPVAGVFVDRWDRRRTLFICDFIRGLLVLAIAFYVMNFPSLTILYGAVFLIFAFSRFYVPAKMAIIPEIVKKEDLHIANSLVTTTGMIALVLGALFGGLIVEYAGSRGGFLWDAATFFVAGALIYSMTSLRHPIGSVDPRKLISTGKEMIAAQKNIWTEIKEGIAYIDGQARLRTIFIMMSILFAAAGAVYVVIIIFIQKAFGSVTKDIGFLAVPLGMGLFLGSIAFGRFGGKVSKWKVIYWSLILGGFLVTCFAASVEGTHNRLLAMGLSFILGMVLGPVVIASNTVIHEVCSSQMSGKVFSALEFVMHLAFLFAMLLSSYLAEHIARVWILIAVGVIFMGVGLVGLFRSKEEQ